MNKYENAFKILSENKNYEILTKIDSNITSYNELKDNRKLFKIAVLDTETTGLNIDELELIDLGYQIITVDANGNIFDVKKSRSFLQEPKDEKSISDEITAITGITYEETKNKSIPWDTVKKDFRDVQLIIAHNASFDRPVMEKYCDIFKELKWGCSLKQIKWEKDLNYYDKKDLNSLNRNLKKNFFDGHRALNDVKATINILNFRHEGTTILKYLFENSKKEKFYINAKNSSFNQKDVLKENDYKWIVQDNIKSWMKEVTEEEILEELKWLKETLNINGELKKVNSKYLFRKNLNFIKDFNSNEFIKKLKEEEENKNKMDNSENMNIDF